MGFSTRPAALSTALLVATASIITATATAAPNAAAEPVNYTATVGETSTVIRTDAGSLVTDNGVFKILAADGTILGGTELSFRGGLGNALVAGQGGWGLVAVAVAVGPCVGADAQPPIGAECSCRSILHSPMRRLYRADRRGLR